MNAAIELQVLRSQADDANSRLTETYDVYVEEVEEESLEKFNVLHRSIVAKIQKDRRAINVLALNGFTWTQEHSNLISV